MAKFNISSMLQGLAGNMQEQTIEELEKEFGLYLFDEEEIKSGLVDTLS